MGRLLRFVVFILALGALAAGTGALLLQERQRENALERRLLASEPPASVAVLDALRAHHTRSQRSLLLLSGLALACLTILALVPARASEPTPAADPALARTEMRGLESLARATNAQRIELDHEREARHRSEQDLHLQQVLANHALQEKIRLGRDLHDGLVQNLYAAGLVLETAAQQLSAAPPAAESAAHLIARAKSTLNAAIREARGTIGGLTPDALAEQSFPDAVESVIDHLDCGRLEERLLRLAPELPAFAEPARTELLQIIRESVSNALRHGGATRIEIDFSPLAVDEALPGSAALSRAPFAAAGLRLRLRIRDNGCGFDPAAVTRGHGLDNLAARARVLGALLDIDSAPGQGSAITLILPHPARSDL